MTDMHAATLTDTQKQAILRLLDDDEETYQLVKTQLLDMDAGTLTALSGDAATLKPIVRDRLRAIHAEKSVQLSLDAIRRLPRLHNGDIALEDGAFLLSTLRDPEFTPQPYKMVLDQMAERVQARITPQTSPREKIGHLAYHLHDERGLRGNQKSYYDPDNSYLDKVIERGLGLPITLSIVYMSVAGRLHLRLEGVGLPTHFVLRYRGPDDEFYVDPFHGGKILDEKACREYVSQLGIAWSNDMIAPFSNARILQRCCRNLIASYERAGQPRLNPALKQWEQQFDDIARRVQ